MCKDSVSPKGSYRTSNWMVKNKGKKKPRKHKVENAIFYPKTTSSLGLTAYLLDPSAIALEGSSEIPYTTKKL